MCGDSCEWKVFQKNRLPLMFAVKQKQTSERRRENGTEFVEIRSHCGTTTEIVNTFYDSCNAKCYYHSKCIIFLLCYVLLTNFTSHLFVMVQPYAKFNFLKSLFIFHSFKYISTFVRYFWQNIRSGRVKYGYVKRRILIISKKKIFPFFKVRCFFRWRLNQKL